MRSKSFFALALAAALVAAPASIRAAPDQTLGMALMSATVSDSGVLVAGSGVASIVRPSTGTYVIAFKRDLDACTCTASFGGHTVGIFTAAQNFISANCPSGAGNNVRVLMSNNGAFVNWPFQLIVFCPK